MIFTDRFFRVELLKRPPRSMLSTRMRSLSARPSPSPTRRTHHWRSAVLLPVLLAVGCSSINSVPPGKASAPSGLDPILAYISSGWDTLARSLSKCDTVADPKLATARVLYLPSQYPVPQAVRTLERDCQVEVRQLPTVIERPGEIDPKQIDPAGLLYLENPYVVPGGRFNEMYGWDSYFIILGLLRDGKIDLARGMVENFFFEIEHYGTVLNANRTYYLSRSQPPFLTSMILAVYDKQTGAGRENRTWLARAYEYAAKDYAEWTRDPHLAGSTGLSRYYDFGSGPAPESLKDDPGYYHQVAAFFLNHPGLGRRYLVGSNPHEPARAQLSADFYKGDRAMRESGFDISFRFGAYGAETHHYAPVCLNSLLYKTEEDLGRMSGILGREDARARWLERAADRRAKIENYLWDPKRGLFFDYDFTKQARSSYEYATTFYPLWAGLATPDEARSVSRNLSRFEQPGGLVMSSYSSGVQWDYPYAWAPVELLAVRGLRRYGYTEEANRISYEFLSMVAENFRCDGTIREKYNGVLRSSEIQVTAGYKPNVVGFGWTNGVFLDLLKELPEDSANRLARDRDVLGCQRTPAAGAHQN
jgi:alpha,alpha-trehalase